MNDLNDRLKVFKEKYDRQEREIAETEKFAASLKPEIERKGNEVMATRFDLESAESQTARIVGDVVGKKRLERDLTTHHAAVRGLQDGLRVKEEILAALVKEEKVSGEKLRKLGREFQNVRAAFWTVVLKMEIEKLRKDQPLLRCIACAQLSCLPVDIPQFLLSTFGDFKPDGMDKVRNELKTEYFQKKGG